MTDETPDPAPEIEEGAERTPSSSDATVRDNREASRYEILLDGEVAYLEYVRRTGTIILVHTEVPPRLRGRGIGSLLAKTALEAARAEQMRVVAKCPFVQAYMKEHNWQP